MEELPLRETMRVPPFPSRIEREVRVGAVAATRPLLMASRGGDFTVCHCCPCPAAADKSGCVAPLLASSENTPCSKFRGGLPALSSGFIGTIPSLPFWRTNTAVDA